VKALRLFPTTLAILITSACVTINVYFPAVAAERAADRIIEDVWGKQAQEAPVEADEPRSSLDLEQRLVGFAMRGLERVVPAAQAQEMNLDISSPAIRALTASMEARHAQLRPYYASGAIGLTGNALLEIRDPGSVALAQRNQLRQLVNAENADRNALYREIAVANNHPEWESQIRATFAKRWVEKAPAGWWYQSNGGWKQK
jgi:uncharacterized protein YdbL (DUF1318 family)